MITMLYAGLLGLWFLALSLRVIKGRSKIGLGDGGDPTMLRLMRGHANFAEYTPLILLLMALLEHQNLGALWLHLLGGALLLGRLLHGYALVFSEHFPPGRYWGTVLTLLCLLAASGASVALALLG